MPALTAGIQNQGLNNYVPRNNATILKNKITISANGANTGATFYQNKEFTVLQDAYAIDWIYNDMILSDNQYIFLVGAISKTIRGNYEWTNKAGWERIKEEKIQLPINNNEIDFEFMDNLVAELEAQRVTQLEAYLTSSELKNYSLTKNETKLLEDYDKLEFAEFNIVDIFDIKNTGNILSRDIKENSGLTPYLCASSENNAVSSYITYDEKYLDKGNCIFIGGKTFVVSYQEKDFYSNDSHNLVLYLKNEERTKLKQFYLATCVNKSLGHKYSWGDSISKTKINKDKILLPIKDGKPYFEIMDKFILAIQKLVIKDVVDYTYKKINSTRKAIEND